MSRAREGSGQTTLWALSPSNFFYEPPNRIGRAWEVCVFVTFFLLWFIRKERELLVNIHFFLFYFGHVFCGSELPMLISMFHYFPVWLCKRYIPSVCQDSSCLFISECSLILVMYARPLVCGCLAAPVNELGRSVLRFSLLLKKCLFRTRQLFLFCSLALMIGETALEHFLPVGFLIWCGLLFYKLSKCIWVNAYSALVGLFVTISLKYLGVHYVHASTWMKLFSLKVEFFKIFFLLISKAVDLLLCNCAITPYVIEAEHWNIFLLGHVC